MLKFSSAVAFSHKHRTFNLLLLISLDLLSFRSICATLFVLFGSRAPKTASPVQLALFSKIAKLLCSTLEPQAQLRSLTFYMFKRKAGHYCKWTLMMSVKQVEMRNSKGEDSQCPPLVNSSRFTAGTPNVTYHQGIFAVRGNCG